MKGRKSAKIKRQMSHKSMSREREREGGELLRHAPPQRLVLDVPPPPHHDADHDDAAYVPISSQTIG